MPLTQVSTGMIADSAVTPGKLSTGAPSWDSAGTITTLGTVNVPDEYYTGAGVGAGASGSWQYKSGASGFIVGNTNGIERFRIDASGRVTMPYQPVFHAYGSQPSLGNNVSAVPGTTLVNIGGGYSTSNGRFTAPIAGTYTFTGTLDWNGATIGQYYGFYFNKNGTNVGQGIWQSPSTGNDNSVTQSITLTLAAGDYMTMRTSYANTPGSTYTNFSGYLIG